MQRDMVCFVLKFDIDIDRSSCPRQILSFSLEWISAHFQLAQRISHGEYSAEVLALDMNFISLVCDVMRQTYRLFVVL